MVIRGLKRYCAGPPLKRQRWIAEVVRDGCAKGAEELSFLYFEKSVDPKV